MTGTLITVAPAPLAASTPDDPAALAGLVAGARDCQALGARVLRLRHDGDPARCGDLIRALAEQTELMVQVDGALAVEAGAELGGIPMSGSAGAIGAAHTRLRDAAVAAVYQVTAVEQLAAVADLLSSAGLPFGAVHVALQLDESAGPAAVVAAAAALAELPPGAILSAVGVGVTALPVLMTALATGGHLCVGTADTPFYAPDLRAESDMQLVARAVGFARLAQRPPLTNAEARALLGVPARVSTH